MSFVLKIITFLAVNAIGFMTITLMFHLLQASGYFFNINEQTIIASMFQGATIAWFLGVLISIGFLILNHGIRFLFLIAPILTVIVYWLKLIVFNS